MRLGLADELGSETDAIRKAADLAKISNYGLVDVNLGTSTRASISFWLRKMEIGLAERLSFPPSPRDDGETLSEGRIYSGDGRSEAGTS